MSPGCFPGISCWSAVEINCNRILSHTVHYLDTWYISRTVYFVMRRYCEQLKPVLFEIISYSLETMLKLRDLMQSDIVYMYLTSCMQCMKATLDYHLGNLCECNAQLSHICFPDIWMDSWNSTQTLYETHWRELCIHAPASCPPPCSFTVLHAM